MSEHIDVEGIHRILRGSGYRDYLCTMTLNLLEKTPEDAAAAFAELIGPEDWGGNNEAFSIEETATGRAWRITSGEGEIEEVETDTILSQIVHLASMSEREVAWVIKRLMAYRHSPGHATDDEIADRLRTLIARVEAT
jgi:hypothetical protein